MAGPYFADMAIVHEGTEGNNGLSSGAAWGGAAGIERMLAVLAAGEVGTILNAAVAANNQPLTDLWKVPVDDTTNMSVGELATLDAVGENATARIAVVVVNDYLLVEEVSGDLNNVAIAETVTTPGGGAGVVDGAGLTQPGPIISADFCVTGTIAAPIKIIGRNSGDTADEAVFLDAASTATNIIRFEGLLDHWHLRGIDGLMPAGAGFSFDATDRDNWVISNVGVRGNAIGDRTGGKGWDGLDTMIRVTLDVVSARFCGGDGFDSIPTTCAVDRLCSQGNAGEGVASTKGGSSITNFVIADNDSEGVRIGGNTVSLKHGVINNNGDGGIQFDAQTRDNTVFKYLRITNNGSYGISDAAGENSSRISDHCVLFNNTGGSTNNFTLGPNDHGAVGDTDIPTVANRNVTDDGYADGGYSLVSDAVLRREAVAVGADTLHVTAGLAPADRPRIPHVAVA